MGFDFGHADGKRFSQNSWVADENAWKGPSSTPNFDFTPPPVEQRTFLDRVKDFGSGIGAGLRKVAEPYRNESINMFDVVLKDPALKESDRIKYQAKKDALLKPGFQPSNTSGNIGDAVGQLVGNAPAFAFGGAATEGIAKGVLSRFAPKLAPKVAPWAEVAVKGGTSLAPVGAMESERLQDIPENVAKNFAIGAGFGVGGKALGIALKPVGNAISKGVDDVRDLFKPLGVPSAPIQPSRLSTPPVRAPIQSPRIEQPTLGGPLNRFQIRQDTRVPGSTIPNTTPRLGEPKIVNERRFAQNVRDSQVAPGEVKANLDRNQLTYEPITNKETLSKANTIVEADAKKARELFDAPSKGISADDVALGESLIVKAIKSGDVDGANKLIADLAEKLTTAGQAVQAASMFKRLSPEGMLLYAQRMVNSTQKDLIATKGLKAPKVELTPEDSKFITDTMKRVQTLDDGREKDIAIAQVMQLIANKVPSTIPEKLLGLQRISLLLNPKTMIRNTLGNSLFGAIDNLSNVVATPIDKVVGKFTKTRTTTLPSLGTQLKGGLRGVKETIQDAKLGVDTYSAKTQYELPSKTIFKGSDIVNKSLDKLDKATKVGLQIGDRPFYNAAYDDVLRQQMKLAKVNKPSQSMIDQAHKVAQQRTYQDVNTFTNAFKLFQRALNGGKPIGLGNAVLPFVKTPANILARAVDYSPVGLTKAFAEARQIGKGKFDQRAFVDAISRSVTGTAIIMVGYDLAKRGIITGSGNKDKDVAAFERGLGKSDFSFKVDDNYYTYDWAQPASLAMAVGADIYLKGKDRKEAENVVLDGVRSGGETLFKQSVMQGIQRFMGGYSPIDNIAETVINAPTQLVPTLSKQFAQLTDPFQRSTYSPTSTGTTANILKSKIPGLSKTLEPKVNTSGEIVKQMQGKNNLFNVFVNPGTSTTFKPNEVQREILRVYESTGDKTIFPKLAPKSLTVKGETITLTPKEITSFQQTLGQVTESRMKAVIRTKQDDEKRVKELADAIEKAYDDAKMNLLASRGIKK
jgi:hypothetical protein